VRGRQRLPYAIGVGSLGEGAGSAIVNAIGPIRQQVSSGAAEERRYLVVAPSAASGPGKPVQIQRP